MNATIDMEVLRPTLPEDFVLKKPGSALLEQQGHPWSEVQDKIALRREDRVWGANPARVQRDHIAVACPQPTASWLDSMDAGDETAVALLPEARELAHDEEHTSELLDVEVLD